MLSFILVSSLTEDRCDCIVICVVSDSEAHLQVPHWWTVWRGFSCIPAGAKFCAFPAHRLHAGVHGLTSHCCSGKEGHGKLTSTLQVCKVCNQSNWLQDENKKENEDQNPQPCACLLSCISGPLCSSQMLFEGTETVLPTMYGSFSCCLSR